MITDELKQKVEEARQAALDVLHFNFKNPHTLQTPLYGLPSASGWVYLEPYTRDLMIAALGILVSKDRVLIEGLRKTLEVTAKNQAERGHIPSYIHDKRNLGASDTTPLFILAVGLFREATKEKDFLKSAVDKAMALMESQSPYEYNLVTQLPTTDWRDEQWVLGYGLYVNAIVYSYLRLHNTHTRLHAWAKKIYQQMNEPVYDETLPRPTEGLTLPNKICYALWSFKVFHKKQFDVLGNSLAILAGIASRARSRKMIKWVETECHAMKIDGKLAKDMDLPPCFFPFIDEDHRDWNERYELHCHPGEYQNGGIWPFICAFYVAALVAAGKTKLAEAKLDALTDLVKPWRDIERKNSDEVRRLREKGLNVNYGFNEWFRARDKTPLGNDWQTWSAAMYLYAAECVETNGTPFFDKIRKRK
ncbi:MAG: glycoside hydrolase 100 family protein [Candidatus Omnitrophota bacterium]